MAAFPKPAVSASEAVVARQARESRARPADTAVLHLAGVRPRSGPDESPLRVAHVNANFTAGSGGITLREAVAVDPARYATAILAPADGTLFDRAEASGVNVIRLRSMGGGRHVYPWADVRAVRELTHRLRQGRFDLVHTHAGRAGALGRIAARKAGCAAVVHTFHGFPFNEFQPAATRRALLEIERRLARLTDWFLTDGTFVASEAVRLGIAPADRIRALISPIDPVPVSSPAARARARTALGVPQDARVIGTTARLATQKSPGDLVRAVARLERPDVFTVWVGDGELRAETESLIDRLGLTGRFLLAGERNDVADLLPAFDVFAMSSLWEGLPCSVVEAMTCGIPVVATAVNSVPEIVVPGRTGIAARPGNPASLARGLAFMLDHPEQAARMAAAARAHVGEAFRPDALGRELMDVYSSALRTARRAA